MTNLITISKNPVWFSLIPAAFFHFYFTDFCPILQYSFYLLFWDLVCSYLPKSLIYINKLFIADSSDGF